MKRSLSVITGPTNNSDTTGSHGALPVPAPPASTPKVSTPPLPNLPPSTSNNKEGRSVKLSVAEAKRWERPARPKKAPATFDIDAYISFCQAANKILPDPSADHGALFAEWLDARVVRLEEGLLEVSELRELYEYEFEPFKKYKQILHPAALVGLVLSEFPGTTMVEGGGRLRIGGLAWIRGRKDSAKPTVPSTAEQTELPNATEPTQTEPDPLDGWVEIVEDVDVWEIDPLEVTRTWLKEVLVAQEDTFIDPMNVLEGFLAAKSATIDSGTTVVDLETEEVAALIRDAFPSPGVKVIEPGNNARNLKGVLGVRWRKLEGIEQSFALHFTPVKEVWYQSASSLVYMPQPDRTRAFLKMFFTAKESHCEAFSLSCVSVWDFYRAAFARTADTHPHLDMVAFNICLFKAFPAAVEVEVAESHTVLRRFAFREHQRMPEAAWRWKRCKDSRRLVKSTGISSVLSRPRNLFTQAMLRNPDPYVPVLRSHSLAQAPSPFLARLRRRAKDPRQPLGDEEPGFPGTSIKAIQKSYFRDEEAMKKHYGAVVAAEARDMLMRDDAAKIPTLAEWRLEAEVVLSGMTLPPVLASGNYIRDAEREVKREEAEIKRKEVEIARKEVEKARLEGEVKELARREADAECERVGEGIGGLALDG